MDEFRQFREDGWPLCPQCGEDELFSLLRWDGGPKPELAKFVEAGMECYRCHWRNQK